MVQPCILKGGQLGPKSQTFIWSQPGAMSLQHWLMKSSYVRVEPAVTGSCRIWRKPIARHMHTKKPSAMQQLQQAKQPSSDLLRCLAP